MIILLEDAEDYLLYEFNECRALKSKTLKVLHVCLTGYTEGLARPPNVSEIKEALEYFFIEDDKVIPHLQSKMFSKNTVHFWEDTPFTKELLRKS